VACECEVCFLLYHRDIAWDPVFHIGTL